MRLTTIRRFFRFRLRSLLVALAICALPMAWVGSLRRQSADEMLAIHDAQMMAASVDASYDFEETTFVQEWPWRWLPFRSWLDFKSWLAGGPIERDVALRFENRSLERNSRGPYGPDGKYVKLHQWTTENVRKLGPVFRRIPRLKSISFSGSPMPAGLLAEILPQVSQIEYLNLRGTQVGPEDFAALEQMENLRNLNLSDTGVTDEDLKHISHCDLTVLRLEDTRITDEGIRSLAHLRNLEFVDLGLTRVSEDVLPVLIAWQVKTKFLVPAEWSSSSLGQLIVKSPDGCKMYRNGNAFIFRPGARAYADVAAAKEK